VVNAKSLKCTEKNNVYLEVHLSSAVLFHHHHHHRHHHHMQGLSLLASAVLRYQAIFFLAFLDQFFRRLMT
jgi:hypothetical protein